MPLCEMVWTPERARKVMDRVESATGQECPCKRNLPCPFIKRADALRVIPRREPSSTDA